MKEKQPKGAEHKTEILRRVAEKRLKGFLKGLLQGLYVDSVLNDEESQSLLHVEPRLIFEPSVAVPWKQDIEPEEFGVCTIDPSLNGELDFEHREIFIPSEQDLKGFEYLPFHVVVEHVLETYGTEYDFPGIEYMKWLIDHPEHVPQSMKGGDFCKFIGSRFRDVKGEWWYFDVQWNDSVLEVWHVDGLFQRWGPADKIILLKKKTIN